VGGHTPVTRDPEYFNGQIPERTGNALYALLVKIVSWKGDTNAIHASKVSCCGQKRPSNMARDLP
jgi:hypothetical protein